MQLITTTTIAAPTITGNGLELEEDPGAPVTAESSKLSDDITVN